MPAVPPRPSVYNLQRFLLGTLPPTEVAAVAAWVDSSPDAARALAGIAAHDALTKAVASTVGLKPPPEAVVARVVANVAGSGAPPTAAQSDPSAQTRASDAATPRPGVPEAVPERIGPFRVVRELGRGGMGVVYEAVEEPLGRRGAVKVLGSAWATNGDARDRFLREARTAADLAPRDHIVTIYQVGEADGAPYLAMELIEGTTLDTWRRTRSEPVTEEDVMWAAGDLLAGLAVAHAKGLVHRDVKPANAMVEAATGRIKILDFGLTRAADGGDQLTSAGRVLGTPAFMSPEQARGEPVDVRSDLFSVGATLHALVTGSSPFTRAESAMATLFAVVHDEAPELTELPAPLRGFVARLLSKSPDDRPADAAAALAELRALRARPAPEPLPDDEPEPAPRRKTRVLLAAAAVLLLAAAVVVIVRDPNGKEVARLEVPDDVAKGGKVEVIDPKTGAKAVVPIPPKKDDPKAGPGKEAPRDPKERPKSLAVGSQVRVTAYTPGYFDNNSATALAFIDPGETGKIVEMQDGAARVRVTLDKSPDTKMWILVDKLEAK